MTSGRAAQDVNCYRPWSAFESDWRHVGVCIYSSCADPAPKESYRLRMYFERAARAPKGLIRVENTLQVYLASARP
jgi:hypothetical protein